jgi:simple sugar transport system ATP-binding protein
MMVGREVNLHIHKDQAKPGDVIFKIDNLSVMDQRNIEKVKSLSLSVRKGEILGIAGIDGNGQKELVEAITCLTKVKDGKIIMNGKEIQNTSPKNVLENKLSTIHEDRHKRGLVLDFTVAENFIIENYGKKPFSNSGMLDYKAIYSFAKESIEKFDIRPTGCEGSFARALSGGNQQKVIIAREVTNDPDLLVAVQPTRGLDVGAIEYVHKMLVHQRDEGKAVLLISLELDEIMDVSDRIAVLYDGQIVADFKQGEVDEYTIGLLMAGGGKADGKVS